MQLLLLTRSFATSNLANLNLKQKKHASKKQVLKHAFKQKFSNTAYNLQVPKHLQDRLNRFFRMLMILISPILRLWINNK
jgi:hypothetical protein